MVTTSAAVMGTWHPKMGTTAKSGTVPLLFPTIRPVENCEELLNDKVIIKLSTNRNIEVNEYRT